MVTRMTLRTAMASAVVLALSAAPAYAAAGGGSAGFRGGGGGGRGRGGGLGWILFWMFAHPIVLVFVVGVAVCLYLYSQLQTARGRARRGARARRVEIAAAEAAEDDESFSPDVVRTQAARLFREIQSAWDSGRRDRLRALVGPDLMVEWERRLDDFERRGWRNRVSVVGGPEIHYVSMTNRADDADDRVVIHVEATLKDVVVDRAGNHLLNHGAGATAQRRLSEYWTLGKRDGRWILLSIEQGAEGAHNLDADLVVTPWDDTARLRDEALVEGAAADKLPEHVSAGELVSVGYEHDARAAALDLSLVDGRFAPDVLEVAVRRVVAAWAEAVDGSDAGLRALSRAEALEELLHPDDPSGRTRLVVRGPRVRSVTIESLDAHAEPPRMTVAVEAEGRRYVEDRDTTRVVSGDPSRPTRFAERWTLTLDGDDANPWRIAYLIRNGRRARVG
jgi:predicted lipid-binding transport protein (Tim44 family)